jgi:proline iminopeptidase
VKIHYTILGDGKPLLLLSGGLGWSSDYLFPVAQGLSKFFRCILIDQRGTGKSVVQTYDTTSITLSTTIDDIEFLRKCFGYEQWYVLGHSVGGLLASTYASNYPGSVSALILVETVGFSTNLWQYYDDNTWCRLLPSDREVVFYWQDSAIVSKDPRRANVEFEKAVLPAYFFDRKKSLFFREQMRTEDFNLDVWKLIWRDMSKIDVSKKSRNYKNPVLVLQGRQDQIGESIPLIVSETYPNSKLVFIERCGHYPWLEQPKFFFDIVRTFLSTQ